jgi:hypothetical protein
MITRYFKSFQHFTLHQSYQTDHPSPRSKLPKHSASLQNTYFHLNVDCVRKKNPHFEFRDILIHNEIKQNLSPEYELLLCY